jgi:tyrosyl-DNA phosphodiesterase 2
MDRVVQQAVQLVEAKRKTADQKPWPLDEPSPQVCYRYHRIDWHPTDLGSEHLDSSLQRLDVWSWNIDFMLPFPSQRLEAALRHLQRLIKTEEETHGSDDIAHVIFLAECLESDLSLLCQDAWVQSTFCLTDLDLTNMESGHYGTVALVDRRLAIQSCFRVHYSKTRMERDGLFVDVMLNSKRIRLCTTHAESLALQPAFRPLQLAICARHMHDPLVYASVLAGDLNAIEPADERIHIENNLTDVSIPKLASSYSSG